MNDLTDVLARIRRALEAAALAVRPFTPGAVAARDKGGGDPVTAADTAINDALRGSLMWPGEGWLSEETADDPARLSARRVWIVDPLDGTREFVEGLPEWCVSVALIEDGASVAGGVMNPATGETVLGAVGAGVSLNGRAARVTARSDLTGARGLASRSEVRRGEWERFRGAPFRFEPMGSVAWKLALVAAGRADATFTLVPKHEWDVAAGVALVHAAGGAAVTLEGAPPRFNAPAPKLAGLVAAPAPLLPALLRALDLPAWVPA